MVEILKKAIPSNRMRVKEVLLPTNYSPLLGTGIDVMSLPEGNLACPKCKEYRFECWVYLDNHRIEMGCMNCNWPCRLLFPLDVSIPGNTGRFTCSRKRAGGKPVDHSKKAMILIHNIDTISIGCELCSNEMIIKLRKAQGLIIPDA